MRLGVLVGLLSVVVALAATRAYAGWDHDGDLAARWLAGHDRAVASGVIVDRRVTLGRSVRGRRITAIEIGNPNSTRRVLVVGCIHGNECAGIAVTRVLERIRPRQWLDLWILPDLNPDGRAAHTRQTARGVDLNRNFPYRWRRSGQPGDLTYSGARPLSAPESRVAWSLIRRIHPTITVWFHQPLGLVDESGGSIVVERRYARLVNLPLRRLPRYHGSASGWQNHRLAGTTAFVVELPPGKLSSGKPRKFAHALITLAQPPTLARPPRTPP